jgi:hypothetical protein
MDTLAQFAGIMLLPLNSACQNGPGETRGDQLVLRYCRFVTNAGCYGYIDLPVLIIRLASEAACWIVRNGPTPFG